MMKMIMKSSTVAGKQFELTKAGSGAIAPRAGEKKKNLPEMMMMLDTIMM